VSDFTVGSTSEQDLGVLNVFTIWWCTEHGRRVKY